MLFARICKVEEGENMTYVSFREAYNILVAPASRQTFSANVAKGAKAGEFSESQGRNFLGRTCAISKAWGEQIAQVTKRGNL